MHVAPNRPVRAETRTGASGRLGVQAAKAAAPDGSTLLLTPIGPMSVFQHVYPTLGYDPFVDFEPVSELGKFDFGIAVAARVPARTLKELVAWAKANPAGARCWLPRRGLAAAFPRRDVRPRRRPRSAARELPRLGRGARRSRRGTDPDHGHHDRRSDRDAQSRPHQDARDRRQSALAIPAGGADAARGRFRY